MAQLVDRVLELPNTMLPVFMGEKVPDRQSVVERIVDARAPIVRR